MKSKGDKIFSFVLGLVSVSFYLFFAFLDGVVIAADSSTYINMSLSREFLYPAILAFFRGLFGEDYLLGVVIFQSVLAAYAAWKVAIYFRDRFSLGYFCSIVIFMIPIFVSLLNRFVAKRGSMYSNSILTEGITISLFCVFFCYLFEYLVEHLRKTLIISVVLATILVALRKQMYITLVLLFVVFLIVQVTSKEAFGKEKVCEWIRGIIKAFLICVGILLTVSLLEHSFNYAVRGRFVGHSSDNRFILTMVFYTAEEEYVELLPEKIQPLFLDIYTKCNEQGYLMSSSDDGWYNAVSHFGANYDFIQLDTMGPTIRQFVETNYTVDATERELIIDEITSGMITSLLPKTMPKIVKVLSNNFLSGLVTTVAQQKRILIYYSIGAYLGYLLLLGLYWKKREEIDNIVKLSVLTLFSIFVNVGLVSAVIFCQTRYTIYNMPLFYCSLCVMFFKLIEMRQGEKI